MITAAEVIQWCRRLAQCTEEPGVTTRTFLSPPMREVHALLSEWMHRLGMTTHIDAAGNLRAHYSFNTPRYLFGSHLDTVPRAGAFDGILGVVLAIALVENTNSKSIEVIGFSEEEGVRFGFPFIGSRALVGTLDDTLLARTDPQGATVRQALTDFGLTPSTTRQLDHKPQAYLEFHIEQGPILESLDSPLGVVTAIAGQTRMLLRFQGHANHAGTTPMALRRDALGAAAEWISLVEDEARNTPGLVATVGRLEVQPGAGNIIPGLVTASLDVRHASDEVRKSTVQHLVHQATGIAARRYLTCSSETLADQRAVPMHPRLCATLAQSVERAGFPVHRLVSGAGHDAMILAPHIPSTMLFLRSPGGLSHHPDESVLEKDVAAALITGQHFLQTLEVPHA